MAMFNRKYMKLFACLLSFCVLTVSVVAQSYPTLKFSANIRSGSSVMPIAVSNELLGGAHSVADIAERDAIHANFRQKGMLVTVLDATAAGYSAAEVVTFMYLGDDEVVDNLKWVATTVVDAGRGAVNALDEGNADGQVLIWDNTDSVWFPASISKISLDSLGNLSLASSLQIAGTQKINSISSDVTLGGVNAADSVIPTQKAVKVYIDSLYTRVTNFNFIRPTSSASWSADKPHLVSVINSSNGDVEIGYTIDNAYPGVGDIKPIATITGGSRSYSWTPGTAGDFSTFKENIRLFAIDADLGDTTVSEPFEIFPPFTGTLTTTDATVCYNGAPNPMSVTSLSGSGDYTFDWKYDDAGNITSEAITTVSSYSPSYTISLGRDYYVDVTDNTTSETITLGPLSYTIKAMVAGDVSADTKSIIGNQSFDILSSVPATGGCNLGYRYYVKDGSGNDISGYTQPDLSYDNNETQSASLGCGLLAQDTYRVYREARWGDSSTPVDGGAMYYTDMSANYVTVNYAPLANAIQSGYTVVASKQLLNTETLTIDWDGCETADYDVYYSIDGSNYSLITTVNGATAYDWTPGSVGDFASYQSMVTIKVTISGETTGFEIVGEQFEVFPLPSAIVLSDYDDAGTKALENTSALTISWSGTNAVDYDIYYSISGGAGVLLKTVSGSTSTTWTPGTSSPFDTYQGDVTIWVVVSGKSAASTYGSESESFKVFQTSSPALSIAVNPICYNSTPGELSVINLAGSGDYTFVWEFDDGAGWQNEAGAPDADKYTPSYTISSTRTYRAQVTDNILGGTITTASLDVNIAVRLAGDINSASESVVGDNSISLTSSTAATAGCGLEYIAYVTDNTGADISGFIQPDSWSASADRTIDLGCSILAAGTYRVYRKARWGSATSPVDGGALYDEALSTSFIDVTYSPIGTVTLSNYTSFAKKALLNTETITLTWEGCTTSQSYDIYYSDDNGTTTTLAASGIASNTTTWTPGAAAPFDVYQNDVILYVTVAGEAPTSDYASASDVFKVYPALTASVSIAQSEICYNSSPGVMSVTGTNGSGTYSYDWQYFDGAIWNSEASTTTYDPTYTISSASDFKVVLSDDNTDATVEATQIITISATVAGTVDVTTSEASFASPEVGDASVTLTGGDVATVGCNLDYRAYITDNTGTAVASQPDAWSASADRSFTLGCSDLAVGTYRIYRQARWGDAIDPLDGGSRYNILTSANYSTLSYKPVNNVVLTGLNAQDAISTTGTLDITWEGCNTNTYNIKYSVDNGATFSSSIKSVTGNSTSVATNLISNSYLDNVIIGVVIDGKADNSGFQDVSSAFTISTGITVTPSSDQDVCYNTAAAGLSSSVSGGSTNPADYSYVWEDSDDNSSWNTLVGETSSTLTPIEKLIADKWYRVTATDNTTGEFGSASINVTVNPSAGAIQSELVYSYAAETITLTNTILADNSSCDAAILYKAVIKATSNVAAANVLEGSPMASEDVSIVLDAGTLSSTTYYVFREVDYDGDGTFDGTSSNYVTLNYNQTGVQLTTPTSASTWKYDDDQTITWTNGAGGTYDLSYSTDNGATWAVLESDQGGTSYIWAGANLSAAIPAYEGDVKIQITDDLTAKVLESDAFVVYPGNLTLTESLDQPLCYNTNAAEMSVTVDPTTGSGSYTYQWQESTDNITYSNVVGATSLTYTPASAFTSDHYYKVKVVDDVTNDSKLSNAIKIDLTYSVGSISTADFYSYGMETIALTSTSGATNNTTCDTDIRYRAVVKSSDEATTYITGSWAATSDASVQLNSTDLATGDYIVVREVDLDGDTNSDFTSTGKPTLSYNATGVVLTAPTTGDELELNSSTNITWTNGGGGTYSLYYDHDGDGSSTVGDNTGWETTIQASTSATSKSWTPSASSVTTFSNTARIKLVDNTTSKEVISDVLVMYKSLSTLSPSISADQTLCYKYDPSAISVVISDAGGSGNYTYQWQESFTEGSGYANIAGQTTNSYDPPASTSSKYFKLVVTDVETSESSYAFGPIKCEVPASAGAIETITFPSSVTDVDDISVISTMAASNSTCNVYYRVVVKTIGGTSVQTGSWLANDSEPTLTINGTLYSTNTQYYVYREIDYDGDGATDAISSGQASIIYQDPAFVVNASSYNVNAGDALTITWNEITGADYIVKWAGDTTSGNIGYVTAGTTSIIWNTVTLDTNIKVEVIVVSSPLFTDKSEPITINP